MFSFRKIVTPTVAALFLVALPAWSALAQESAVKASPQEPAVKAPPEETLKDLPQETSKSARSEVVVRVNGTIITRMELERAVNVMLARNQVKPPLPPEIMKQAEEKALEDLTRAELLYQEASKLEIKDLDKQVADVIAQNKVKLGTQAEFDKALKGVDMTLKDLVEFTRKDLVLNNFIEKRFTVPPAEADAEARKFYDENLDRYFKKPETLRASHILIGTDEKLSPEDRKKAKEKAEAILKRVKAGEDFAAIAKSDSSCPSSAEGGDLGYFARGQMVPPFEKAAFALQPGQISDVVETQFGYHVIKVTEKQDAKTEPFENVKVKIVEALKQKRVLDYIEGLKKTAKIEKQS
jgi:peptidyl-prolyl cis-trans isomerase C